MAYGVSQSTKIKAPVHVLHRPRARAVSYCMRMRINVSPSCARACQLTTFLADTSRSAISRHPSRKTTRNAHAHILPRAGHGRRLRTYVPRPYQSTHACIHTHTRGTPRTHACMCTHTRVTFRPESKSGLGSCETSCA